jgi:hypothetical protein
MYTGIERVGPSALRAVSPTLFTFTPSVPRNSRNLMEAAPIVRNAQVRIMQ